VKVSFSSIVQTSQKVQEKAVRQIKMLTGTWRQLSLLLVLRFHLAMAGALPDDILHREVTASYSSTHACIHMHMT
jgi:hypothetical protein